MTGMNLLFELALFLAGFSFVGVLTLGLILRRLWGHYQRLAAVKSGVSLDKILDQIVAQLGTDKQEIKALRRQLTTLAEKQTWRFHKVGLVKFNPFRETGGQQSFVLAILNEQQRGLVLTSFHGRQGTRIYAKIIKPGVTLSREEKAAIKQAKEERK